MATLSPAQALRLAKPGSIRDLGRGSYTSPKLNCSSFPRHTLSAVCQSRQGDERIRETAQLAEERCMTSALAEGIKRCALCLGAAAVVSLSQLPALEPVQALDLAAAAANPAISDLGVLISGPPQKDARALLRNALPIDNKPIQDIQRTLEGITDDLKTPGVRAIENAERTVRQATRILNTNRDKILADVAPAKKAEGQQLLGDLIASLQEFQGVFEAKDKSKVLPQQKKVLSIVGDIEEAMVAKFPFEVPQEFASMPQLKGRATVEMVVKPKDNPNLKSVTLQIVVDGYNAPVTAGNFVDLVERHFYDGMEIQRADGFVVQTGDPDGPEEGFIDPATGIERKIPLEIKVATDKEPIYGDTLEDLGRYKALTSLPFNAFGTLAMAREEFTNDSASSQIFWLLKESELTPSSANILDGRYAVFGYVVDNEEYLADLKVGDIIESMKVTNGLDNLVTPKST